MGPSSTPTDHMGRGECETWEGVWDLCGDSHSGSDTGVRVRTDTRGPGGAGGDSSLQGERDSKTGLFPKYECRDGPPPEETVSPVSRRTAHRWEVGLRT